MKNKIMSILSLFLLAAIVSGCPDGKLDPSPQPLDFGNVYVGSSSSRTASWKNNGSQPAAINGMAVSSPPTFTGPAAVNEIVNDGDKSSDFNFVFAPSSADTFNGEAQIFAANVRPKKLRLTGTGVFQKNGSTVSLVDIPASEAFDFKETPVGANKTKAFKLKNNDPAKDAIVSSVWRNGNNVFAVVNPAGNITIPANGEAAVTVTFTPAAAADYTDILEFTNIDNIAGTVVKGKGVQG